MVRVYRSAPLKRDTSLKPDFSATRIDALFSPVIPALCGAEVGAQHHVEVARFGPLATGAAVRADEIGRASCRERV